MDMQMPVMNVLDAARAIRALPFPEAKQSPVIALTAIAYLEDSVYWIRNILWNTTRTPSKPSKTV